MILKKTTKEIIITGELGTLVKVKEALQELNIEDLEFKLNPETSYLTMTRVEVGQCYGRE